MRIKPKPLKDYTWYLRPFFWNQRRKYRAVLDAGLLWGRSPKLFVCVALLHGAINRKSSPLNPALKSLVTVRVSQINACAFCVDINSATLLKCGVPLEKVEALSAWKKSELFDDKERVSLEYAEMMTRSDIQVNDKLIERVKQYFSDNEVIELTGLIAYQNMSSKFNNALKVPSQGFCQIPATFEGAD